MKLLKPIFILLVLIATISCKKEVESENENTIIALEENLQNVEVSIEGMTCEIGCAKLIESKTYKLDGMTYSNVSFENKLGQFTFDSNKISIADIEKHINGIAGGELYKVVSTKLVDEFTTIQTVAN